MAESEDEVAPLKKVDFEFTTGKGDSRKKWAVHQFWAKERVGRPYQGVVDILAEGEVAWQELLGQNCVLTLSRGPERKRTFKGIVTRVEHLGSDAGQSFARIDFAAAALALSHGQNTRIFQDVTAAEVIEKVLKEGVDPFDRKVEVQLTKKYPKREHITQWDEDDLTFVHRLMQKVGITWYYKQGGEGETETLVLVDRNDSFPKIETMPKPEAPGYRPPPVAPEQLREQYLRMKLLGDGEPRSPKAYVLKFNEGSERKGQTTSDGMLVEKIPAGARTARVLVEGSDLGLEEHVVNLGMLRYATGIGGVQQRLRNAGLLRSASGQMDEQTKGALAQFQERQQLKVTGDLDDETRAKLEEVHES